MNHNFVEGCVSDSCAWIMKRGFDGNPDLLCDLPKLAEVHQSPTSSPVRDESSGLHEPICTTCGKPEDAIEYVRARPADVEELAREAAGKYFVKVLASIDAAKNSPLESERVWASQASETTQTAMNALESIIVSVFTTGEKNSGEAGKDLAGGIY